ncbi:MAG: type II toxin-antitoxin system Phd/YefM family antitoxin [Candidatus Dormibacteraceae bacterium]
MNWQVQEAKQKFSELVRQAENDGPQMVTRHGEPVVVVISEEEFRKLQGDRPSFKDLLSAPPYLDDFDKLIERDRSPMREIDLYDPEYSGQS